MPIYKLRRDCEESSKMSVESAHEYAESTSIVGSLHKLGETVL